MMNPNTAWPLIRQNAQKAFLTNTIWHSIVEKAPYRVIEIDSEYLIIARLNGGDNDKLTSKMVYKAAELFNESNCRIKRRTLISPTVAKETAFVLFHPFVTWDDTGEFIIEANISK
jgi:hypothetical protein